MKPGLKVVTLNDSDFMEVTPLLAFCRLAASSSLLLMNIDSHGARSDSNIYHTDTVVRWLWALTS